MSKYYVELTARVFETNEKGEYLTESEQANAIGFDLETEGEVDLNALLAGSRNTFTEAVAASAVQQKKARELVEDPQTGRWVSRELHSITESDTEPPPNLSGRCGKCGSLLHALAACPMMAP